MQYRIGAEELFQVLKEPGFHGFIRVLPLGVAVTDLPGHVRNDNIATIAACGEAVNASASAPNHQIIEGRLRPC